MKTPEKFESFGYSLVLLSLITFLLWLVSIAPAYYFSGILGVEGLTLSAFLCLIPGWLAFWIVSRYGDASDFVIASFASTLVRMFFVLTGVLIVKSTKRYSEITDFLVWVILFFLGTLAIETWLTIKHLQATKSKSEDTTIS